ncbi:MAG: hypothetical protein M3H12_17785 [Chromatiales bacterium]|nr:hypothetical protein [Gammaproteobacteria bacterium]
MKRSIIAISALLFAGTAGAASDWEIYRGFAPGNPDLSTGSTYKSVATAVQPGIGSSTGTRSHSPATDYDIYRGFASGNSDLSSDMAPSLRTANVPGIGLGTGLRGSASNHFIYHGFEKDNPDL